MCSLHSSCPPMVTTRVRCDKRIQAAHNRDGEVPPVPAAFNSRIFPLSVLQLSDRRIPDHRIPCLPPCLCHSVGSGFASGGTPPAHPRNKGLMRRHPGVNLGLVLRSQVPNTKYQLPSFKLSMTLGTTARHSQ